jgi:cytochrome P450
VQAKLQGEIDAAYEAADGSYLDYQTIQNLPYLDMVINETLRLHPALGVLERVCTKESYKVSFWLLILKSFLKCAIET